MFVNKYAISQINYQNTEEIRMEPFSMEMLESLKALETKRP